jgi:hypothetical protein
MNRQPIAVRISFSSSLVRLLCYRRITPHNREDDHGEESEDNKS